MEGPDRNTLKKIKAQREQLKAIEKTSPLHHHEQE
jgi:hypothetical protein